MTDKMVVASQVKHYIKNKAGLNTSASVMGPLSKIIARECDKAIQNAQNSNRKTVLERDVQSDQSWSL